MKLHDIKKIGVVGAGTMGHGIALSFALWGYPTILSDTKNQILRDSIVRIKSTLGTFVEEEIITQKQADDTMGRLTITTDLAALARDVDYICEAIVEQSQDKQELFNKLDALCPPHTILASNTGSMVLSDFGSSVKRQDKIVITHYFNPPHIIPCVEVVKGKGTSDETFELTYALLEKVKKSPVKVLTELPGYLVNRIQTAMLREIFDLWARGVASTEDIDRAVSSSFGFRLASIGPLLTADLAGMPQTGPRAVGDFKRLFTCISDAKEVPEKLSKRWNCYQGFYDYSKEQFDQIIKQRDKAFLRQLKEMYKKLNK